MDAMKKKKADRAEKVVQNFLRKVQRYDVDDLFEDEMVQEGSVKINAKVRKPDEFDFSWGLNLYDFKLSRKGKAWVNGKCSGHSHKTESACLKETKWKESKTHISKDDVFLRCIHTDDEDFEDVSIDGCIPPRMISEYLYDCVCRAKKHEKYDVIKVSRRLHGPAVTVTIEHEGIGHKINVDITARLDVKFGDLPDETQDALRDIVSSFPRCVQEYICREGKLGHLRRLYLVPKTEDGWVLSFANYENLIINDFASAETCKKVLRNVKLILAGWMDRAHDSTGATLGHVSSYMLKTILLKMIIDKPESRYWSIMEQWNRYQEMLKRLRKCAEDRNLPAVFDPDTNLFENVTKRSCKKLIRYINKEINSSDDSSDDSSYDSTDNSSGYFSLERHED